MGVLPGCARPDGVVGHERTIDLGGGGHTRTGGALVVQRRTKCDGKNSWRRNQKPGNLPNLRASDPCAPTRLGLCVVYLGKNKSGLTLGDYNKIFGILLRATNLNRGPGHGRQNSIYRPM